MTSFSPKKTSPLQGLTSPSNGIELSEVPFMGKVNIRGNADDATFLAAASKVLSLVLPTQPNTVASSEDFTVFWMGPDEWLIHIHAEDAQAALVASLNAAFDGMHTAVTDVSDYYLVIEITGKGVPDILARGCPLDLHPRSFKVGDCAQSYFAHASVLIYQEEVETWYVQVRWTYAAYLWNYFADVTKHLAA